MLLSVQISCIRQTAETWMFIVGRPRSPLFPFRSSCAYPHLPHCMRCLSASGYESRSSVHRLHPPVKRRESMLVVPIRLGNSASRSTLSPLLQLMPKNTPMLHGSLQERERPKKTLPALFCPSHRPSSPRLAPLSTIIGPEGYTASG